MRRVSPFQQRRSNVFLTIDAGRCRDGKRCGEPHFIRRPAAPSPAKDLVPSRCVVSGHFPVGVQVYREGPGRTVPASMPGGKFPTEALAAVSPHRPGSRWPEPIHQLGLGRDVFFDLSNFAVFVDPAVSDTAYKRRGEQHRRNDSDSFLHVVLFLRDSKSAAINTPERGKLQGAPPRHGA